MRTIALLSLALLAFAARVSAQEIPDKEVMGLKGPVKSVRIKMQRAAQGAPAGEARLDDSEITLDREGRKVELAYYNPDGSLWRREVFTYDAAGRTEVTYNPDGTVHHRLYRQKEKFDKEHRTGRFVVSGEGREGTSYTEFVTKYDERGRRLEGFTYDREGKLQSHSVSVYGADGRLQEFLHYNGAGVLLQRWVIVPEGTQQVFTYDNGGALVSAETRRRDVCSESDPYGNCKSQTAAWTVTKGGKVEEVTVTTSRTFTYF